MLFFGTWVNQSSSFLPLSLLIQCLLLLPLLLLIGTWKCKINMNRKKATQQIFAEQRRKDFKLFFFYLYAAWKTNKQALSRGFESTKGNLNGKYCCCYFCGRAIVHLNLFSEFFEFPRLFLLLFFRCHKPRHLVEREMMVVVRKT